MFYQIENKEYRLSFDRFNSCVAPRPIGWIFRISQDGVSNPAPYSQFQNLTFDPPLCHIFRQPEYAGASQGFHHKCRTDRRIRL